MKTNKHLKKAQYKQSKAENEGIELKWSVAKPPLGF